MYHKLRVDKFTLPLNPESKVLGSVVWQPFICHRTGLTLRGLTREAMQEVMVLFTKFYDYIWHYPLSMSNWVQIDQTIEQQAADDLQAVQAVYCTKNLTTMY